MNSDKGNIVLEEEIVLALDRVQCLFSRMTTVCNNRSYWNNYMDVT